MFLKNMIDNNFFGRSAIISIKVHFLTVYFLEALQYHLHVLQACQKLEKIMGILYNMNIFSFEIFMGSQLMNRILQCFKMFTQLFTVLYLMLLHYDQENYDLTDSLETSRIYTFSPFFEFSRGSRHALLLTEVS